MSDLLADVKWEQTTHIGAPIAILFIEPKGGGKRMAGKTEKNYVSLQHIIDAHLEIIPKAERYKRESRVSKVAPKLPKGKIGKVVKRK